MKPFSWVQEYVEQLAHDNPDNAMVPDQYFYSDGRPCCIFGHVLHALGAKPFNDEDEGISYVLAPDDETVVVEGDGAHYIDWPKLGVEHPSASEGHWAQEVQERQDSGESWGRAVFPDA